MSHIIPTLTGTTFDPKPGDIFEVIIPVQFCVAVNNYWVLDEFRLAQTGEKFIVHKADNMNKYRIEIMVWGMQYLLERGWINDKYIRQL